MVETRQYDFAELRPFRNQSEMQKILDSFEEKNQKRMYDSFGTKSENQNIQ